MRLYAELDKVTLAQFQQMAEIIEKLEARIVHLEHLAEGKHFVRADRLFTCWRNKC